METYHSALALFLFGISLLATGHASATEDEDGVYTLTRPERTLEQVEAASARMPPVTYCPPASRWKRLPRTRDLLRKKGSELRVVMLGDSIVNDTSRSRWEERVQREHPHCKITKVTVVRGSTGCWWYKEEGRVKRYVVPHRPDLLIIGGISQNDDIDAIREVIRQARDATGCDILLMTGAFGTVDPRDDQQWQFDLPRDHSHYRTRLKGLADEMKAAFLDMTAHWGRAIRESGEALEAFKRDEIHANEWGEQILGRILAAYLMPDGK